MRTLRIFLTALLLTVSVAAFAQAQGDDPASQIGDLRSQLDQAEKAMKDENIHDSTIDQLRGTASDIAGKAQKVSSSLSPTRDSRGSTVTPTPARTTASSDSVLRT